MFRLRLSVCSLIALTVVMSGCGSSCEAPQDLLITNATIIDLTTGSLSDPQQILIDGGEITSIEPMSAHQPPVVVETIDASGGFILPGLIDVHAHIGDGGLGEQTLADQEQALEQFVRFGVTTIFVPGGGGGNDEQLTEWKRRCVAGEIVCPGLFGSGDILTSYGSHPITTIWAMDANVDPELAHQRGARSIRPDEAVTPYIAQKVKADVDAIKIIVDDGPGPFYPRPIFLAEKVKEIVDAATAHNLNVVAHVSTAQHITIAVQGGVHATMHSAEDLIPDPLLATMAERGVHYVATLALYDGFDDKAHGRREQDSYAERNVSPRALESLRDDAYWERVMDSPEESEAFMQSIFSNLIRAEKAGVPIALGTDVNNPQVFPGYSVHEEMELMVAAGFSPRRALLAATTGGAHFLEATDELGSIEVGYKADLIILDQNPLDEITHSRSLRLVIQNGNVVRETAQLR